MEQQGNTQVGNRDNGKKSSSIDNTHRGKIKALKSREEREAFIITLLLPVDIEQRGSAEQRDQDRQEVLERRPEEGDHVHLANHLTKRCKRNTKRTMKELLEIETIEIKTRR